MNDKIKYFPITSFAVIMGLSGLTIVFAKFYHLHWFPRIIYDVSSYTVLSLFTIISMLYAIKFLVFPEQVKADFSHRIRINFFSAISISLLLLSIAFMGFHPQLSKYLWYAGVVLHSFFMLKTIGFWIQHSFEIQHFNPAWFIPVVGNILVPVSGVEYAPVMFSFFYFSVGFFFWIVLFTIFIYRAIFHSQLPEKFIPTFFILLAPPAVGFISYMRITSSWDNFAIFMLFIAYFIVLLLITMHKSFMRLKFFMSWWAFTFPLAAVTIASTLAYQTSKLVFFKYTAFVMFVALVTAISIVGWQTIKHIRKGEICINED